jgi:hypothetical protein
LGGKEEREGKKV